MDIRLVNLTKIFADKNSEVRAVDNLDITIPSGKLIGLLGPSGCGKSTTLYMIAGLLEPSSGQIFFGEDDVTALSAEKRGIGLVFQNYALYPHMTVRQNIMFPLQNMKLPKAEILARTVKYSRLVGIEELLDRKPKQLSGGQQQRVAIARALVKEPKVLLLDEPLGALDLKLRQEMQIELKRMQQKLGITFIFVTHDQEEALSMSDTIVVMNKGKIQQMGTPEDIYNEPKNSFVARFIGESNIFDGIMLDDFKVEFCGKLFDCVDKGFEKNENIEVVIRPEDIKMVEPNEGMLKGIVTSTVFKGVHYEILVKENDRVWMLHNTKSAEVGSELGMDIYPEDIHIMRKEEN